MTETSELHVSMQDVDTQNDSPASRLRNDFKLCNHDGMETVLSAMVDLLVVNRCREKSKLFSPPQCKPSNTVIQKEGGKTKILQVSLRRFPRVHLTSSYLSGVEDTKQHTSQQREHAEMDK